MARLRLPFLLHGVSSEIVVSVEPGTDFAGDGCDLVAPLESAAASAGFPVCRATVGTTAHGYRAIAGWVQLVASTDGGEGYELDLPPALQGSGSPFAYFGSAPSLFDAPLRGTRDDVSWRARSFLCAIPDALRTRVVDPLVAFEWGFDLRDGSVALRGPEESDLAVWDTHRPVLQGACRGWTFRAAHASAAPGAAGD